CRINPPLFNGYELMNTASSYYAIMRPTLNLLTDALAWGQNTKGNNGTAYSTDPFSNQVKFLDNAKRQGWILAGSYFYDVAGIASVTKDFMIDQNDLTVSVPDLNGGGLDDWTRGDNPFLQPGYIDLIKAGLSDVSEYVTSAAPFGVGKDVASVANRGNPGITEQAVGAITGIGGLDNMRFKGGVFNMMGSIGTLLIKMIVMPLLTMIMSMTNIVVLAITLALNLLLSAWVIIWAIMIEDIMTGVVNPMVGLTLVGNMLIDQSVMIWQGSLTLFAMSAGGIAIAPQVFAIMAMAGPVLLGVLLAMFTAGLTLAYYIPLLPYIFFILGAVSWMIAVIEAMVAAPLVALGIMHPEGNSELFGKAGDSALPLLFNLFLRPTMMVIGYVGAILLSYAAIQLLHFSIGRAMTPIVGMGSLVPGLEMLSFSGIAKAIALLCVYVIMHVVLLEKSFSLIYILPDQVLRWVFSGFRDDRAADTPQMAGKVSGALSQGASQISSAVAYRMPSPVKSKGEKPEDSVDAKKPGGDNASSGNSTPSKPTEYEKSQLS
ncbi:MAG: DotA/TraY family protein, partial [Gammaproteobacteria bacterium]